MSIDTVEHTENDGEQVISFGRNSYELFKKQLKCCFLVIFRVFQMFEQIIKKNILTVLRICRKSFPRTQNAFHHRIQCLLGYQ